MRAYICGILSVFATVTGCAHGSSVVVSRGTLPLQRVVVYRNGIGYFERQGPVRDDHVEFRVRQSEVGDFLATLAVMERGGSSVRSAAFPMAQENHPNDDSTRRSVRLSLDGRDHDLTVGYMIETPIWRPSYRLVLSPQGAQVQSWGIVQNISGEDWSNVHLSLVAGAPVSFRSELAEAAVSVRPLVTDRGEVIDAVPRGEIALAQQNAQGSPTTATTTTTPMTQQQPPIGGLVADEDSDDVQDVEDSAQGSSQHHEGRGHARPSRTSASSSGGGSAGYDAPAPMARRRVSEQQQTATRAPGPSAPRSVASLAAVAMQGGVTRYDLPNAVTIPDHTATMVMLSVRNVPGESVYLYAPDSSVPDSAMHPFHVARFENRTGGMLERGPLAIFESGSFLGQGMLEPLPDGATATIPFALERALAVESSVTESIEGARLLRVVHNDITIERFRIQRTTYRVRNGMDHDVHVVMRQSLSPEMTLFQPPTGTEQANGSALVPIAVGTRSNATSEVQTRVAFAMSVDWSNDEAAVAIEAYLHDGHPAQATATLLRSALDLRTQLSDLVRDRVGIQSRLDDLQQNASETRLNLLTLRANRGAQTLRSQLVTRLAQMATQIDQLTRRIVTQDTQIGERRVQLAEAVREISLDTTVSTSPASSAAPLISSHP